MDVFDINKMRWAPCCGVSFCGCNARLCEVSALFSQNKVTKSPWASVQGSVRGLLVTSCVAEGEEKKSAERRRERRMKSPLRVSRDSVLVPSRQESPLARVRF